MKLYFMRNTQKRGRLPRLKNKQYIITHPLVMLPHGGINFELFECEDTKINKQLLMMYKLQTPVFILDTTDKLHAKLVAEAKKYNQAVEDNSTAYSDMRAANAYFEYLLWYKKDKVGAKAHKKVCTQASIVYNKKRAASRSAMEGLSALLNDPKVRDPIFTTLK